MEAPASMNLSNHSAFVWKIRACVDHLVAVVVEVGAMTQNSPVAEILSKKSEDAEALSGTQRKTPHCPGEQDAGLTGASQNFGKSDGFRT
jgi:hypothetical protein